MFCHVFFVSSSQQEDVPWVVEVNLQVSSKPISLGCFMHWARNSRNQTHVIFGYWPGLLEVVILQANSIAQALGKKPCTFEQ